MGRRRRAEQRTIEEGRPDWAEWWRKYGERELRCILMTAWDPVGASESAAAWDEYDSYLADIALHLRDKPGDEAKVEAVADRLTAIQVEYMGHQYADVVERNGWLAKSIVAWHEWSFERGGRPPHEWLDD